MKYHFLKFSFYFGKIVIIACRNLGSAIRLSVILSSICLIVIDKIIRLDRIFFTLNRRSPVPLRATNPKAEFGIGAKGIHD